MKLAKIITEAERILGLCESNRKVNRKILRRCANLSISGLTYNYLSSNNIVIDENVTLYGILTEYAIMMGLENEAKIYNRKFEDLVLQMGRNGKMRRMPA